MTTDLKLSEADEVAVRAVGTGVLNWPASRLRILINLARHHWGVKGIARMMATGQPTVRRKVSALKAAGADFEALDL